MKTKAKKAGAGVTKYKKAPDAPKRFKSAFIIFSAEKHREIKKTLLGEGKTVKTTDIAKMVSGAWKGLDPEERKEWDDRAEKDKARYEAEKAQYKGPWKVPSSKRKVKDPSAPKRPMSAFLAYSNKRRAGLKRQNPKATNADLSRMLSQSWKELDPEERAEYMTEERKLREEYKAQMSEWRKKCAETKKAEREEREIELAAFQAAEAARGQQGLDAEAMDAPQSGPTDNKWMGMPPQQDPQQQNQQDPQQQRMGAAGAGMFVNPYLQAAAFGGATAVPGMDARAAALGLNPSANPYITNNFAAQGYMQGMQGGGNPALSSLFGAQSYMPGAGMPGQLPPAFYGANFGMNGMNGGDGATGGPVYGHMQS